VGAPVPIVAEPVQDVLFVIAYGGTMAEEVGTEVPWLTEDFSVVETLVVVGTSGVVEAPVVVGATGVVETSVGVDEGAEVELGGTAVEVVTGFGPILETTQSDASPV
jgi:hypothetical protein